MVRIARERISSLFALAEREAATGHAELADRYVTLARRIGMRYNIRLLTEYRELYCRGCSTFWVEGRTVRTRLRSGRRTRTCLKCGRVRRTRVRGRAPGSDPTPSAILPGAPRDEAALVSGLLGEEETESPEDESQEE
jgi:ribonuclease P protein subunit RPR2